MLASPHRRLRATAPPILLALLAFVAHRPLTMLHRPFWLDEAWVADSVKVPFGDLHRLTSSTPIGFTLLLRLVPHLGPAERLRVVPLLFAAALGPLGWLLGRELDREHRMTAYVLGVTGAVLPAGLLRHDLKQYTADAAVSLALLWLGARAERLRDTRSLLALGATAAVACFVSHTTVLVAAAVFGALTVTALARRSWRDAAVTAGVGATTGAWLLAVYVLLARQEKTPALVAYWKGYYVPGHGAGHWLVHQTSILLRYVGTGPGAIALVLLVLGTVALVRAGRTATALVLPLLTVIALGAAKAQAYPFGERRTALYYLAIATMVATYAIARAATTKAAPVALLAGALLVGGSAVRAGRSNVPYENVRAMARYLATHAGPDDRILVHGDASYAFAFYWDADRATYVADTTRAVGFSPAYPADSRVRIVTPTTMQLDRPTVWLVVSHASESIVTRYKAAAAAYGTVTVVRDGGGVLLRVDET